MAVTVDDRQGRVRGHRPRLAEAGRRALAAVGRAGADLDLSIVGDVEIRAMNQAFRGVRRRTDVLAFPLEVPGVPVSLVGQVVISADTARQQARRLGVPLEAELALLVTHGVLHLVGWDDRDPVEATLMHARERQILAGSGRRWPVRLWAGLPGG